MLSRVAQLKAMGFSEAVAKRVLSECAWDVNAAIDRLLTSGAPEEEEQPPPPAPAPIKIDEAHAQPPSPETRAALEVEVTSELDIDAARANGRTDPSGAPGGAADSNNAETSAPAVEPAGATQAAPAPTQLEVASDPAPAEPSALASVAEPVLSEQAPAEAAAEVVDCKDTSAQVADVAVPGADAAAGPRKRIERVAQTWSAEDPSQLSVTESEFVSVWVGTDTENGWIHAEGHDDPARVGWLPVCVLKTLPDGHRWMRAEQAWKAIDESQCSLGASSMAIVWVGSRTAEGWTYAEVEQQDGETKTGWLPVFCLAWTED